MARIAKDCWLYETCEARHECISIDYCPHKCLAFMTKNDHKKLHPKLYFTEEVPKMETPKDHYSRGSSRDIRGSGGGAGLGLGGDDRAKDIPHRQPKMVVCRENDA